MNLDDWRAINYFVADINAYSLFVVCLFCLFNFIKLNKQFRLIAYYIFVSTVLEIAAKIFLKKQLSEDYFTFNNHLYVFFEALFIGLFIYKTLKIAFFKKIVIFGVCGILIFQARAFFSQPLLDSQYSSALLASVFCFLLLFALFDQSQQLYKGKFFKSPSVIILFAFLFAYLILLILFWFLPSVIEYSRILANILIIIKNTIGIFFYLAIVFSLWKSLQKK